MSAARSKILVLCVGLLGGWLLAGSTRSIDSDVSGSPDSRAPQSVARYPALNDPADLRSWSRQSIPADEFEGIFEIRGAPALNVEHQSEIGSDSNRIFPNTEALKALSTWLDLSSSERQQLLDILEQTAVRHIDWEKSNLTVERIVAGKYELRWHEPPSETIATFKQDLAEAFGPPLARSIWIRGGLDRYFDPLPGWKQRAIEKITIQVFVAAGSVRVNNGDFEMVWTSEGREPAKRVPIRLQHLLDVGADVAEMTRAAEAGDKSAYPEAEWDRPGFLRSPYNGKPIDVRGIPPGTLVADPTMPSEAKAFFRVPPE